LDPNKYQKRLRTPKAAAYLALSPSTLAKMRLTGDGPAYSKLGRIVVYEISDLDEYADARRRHSTSDPATVLEPVSNGSRPSPAKADQKSQIFSPSCERSAQHHRRPRGSPPKTRECVEGAIPAQEHVHQSAAENQPPEARSPRRSRKNQQSAGGVAG
jgi:hypothetical protein